MSGKGGALYTDYEEGIVFDMDDPDFEDSPSATMNVITQRTQLMSLVGSRVGSCRSSWSDEQQPQEPVLSIEELRLQLNSCFSCGVSWQDEHVSLDCAECGGYSLERPCPVCDGHCAATWSRDITMSHASGKARWEGCCRLAESEQRMLSQPSLRLEKISATS